MRFLTTFARALADVIANRKNKQFDEALAILSDAFAEDREAAALVDLSLNDFIQKVDYMEDFDARKWSMAAELLQEKSLILASQGKQFESEICSIKALHLVLEVLLSDPETFRQSTLDLYAELRHTLSIEKMPESTFLSIQEYENLRSSLN